MLPFAVNNKFASTAVAELLVIVITELVPLMLAVVADCAKMLELTRNKQTRPRTLVPKPLRFGFLFKFFVIIIIVSGAKLEQEKHINKP